MNNKFESQLKITVIGVGGAGGNIITTLAKENIPGIDVYITNTDVQDLLSRDVENKIELGPQTTKGFGAGSQPEIGKKAFEESKATIEKIIEGSHIVFTVFGLGGGTGSGAGPEIAKLAKEKGALSIVLATLPFDNEGKRKQSIAKQACELIETYCDSYTLFSNARLLIQSQDESMKNAFFKIDNQIRKSITTITNIVKVPGKINIDFADVRAMLTNAGHTIIATGQAAGHNAASMAVENATENPLFEGSINGCTKAIVNLVANPNVSLSEQNNAIEKLKSFALADDIDIVPGLTFQEELADEVNVSIIATGLNKEIEVQDVYEQQELAKKIENNHFKTKENSLSLISDEMFDEDLEESNLFDESIPEIITESIEESKLESFDDSYDGSIYDDTQVLSEEVEELSNDEDIFEFEE